MYLYGILGLNRANPQTIWTRLGLDLGWVCFSFWDPVGSWGVAMTQVCLFRCWLPWRTLYGISLLRPHNLYTRNQVIKQYRAIKSHILLTPQEGRNRVGYFQYEYNLVIKYPHPTFEDGRNRSLNYKVSAPYEKIRKLKNNKIGIYIVFFFNEVCIERVALKFPRKMCCI